MNFKLICSFLLILALGFASCTGAESEDPNVDTPTADGLQLSDIEGQWILSSAKMDGASSNMLDESYFNIDAASKQIKTNMPFSDSEETAISFDQDGSKLIPENIETSFNIQSASDDKLVMNFEFANHEFTTTFERPVEE